MTRKSRKQELKNIKDLKKAIYNPNIIVTFDLEHEDPENPGSVANYTVEYLNLNKQEKIEKKDVTLVIENDYIDLFNVLKEECHLYPILDRCNITDFVEYCESI